METLGIEKVWVLIMLGEWKKDENLDDLNRKILENGNDNISTEICGIDPKLERICVNFANSPEAHFTSFFESSKEIITICECRPDFLNFLKQNWFFESFALFVCRNLVDYIETPNPLFQHNILQLLLAFSFLPDVCLLLKDVLRLFQRTIFSANIEIQRLTLECLDNFINESEEVCFLVNYMGFPTNFYSIIISSKPENRDIVTLVSNIFVSFLSNCTSYTPIESRLIFSVAFELMKYDCFVDCVCQILSYFAKIKEEPNACIINNSVKLLDFLQNARNSPKLNYLMQFFTLRCYNHDETVSFLSNGLFERLKTTFIVDDKNDLNPNENQMQWCGKLISVVISTVPESIELFLQLDLFRIYAFLLSEGNDLLKSSAMMVISQLVFYLGQQPGLISLLNPELFVGITTNALDMISHDQTQIVTSVLDYLFSSLSIEPIKMIVLPIICENENSETIKEIAHDVDSEVDMVNKAELIERIIDETIENE